MLTVMERFGQISMHKISIKNQVQFFDASMTINGHFTDSVIDMITVQFTSRDHRVISHLPNSDTWDSHCSFTKAFVCVRLKTLRVKFIR